MEEELSDSKCLLTSSPSIALELKEPNLHPLERSPVRKSRYGRTHKPKVVEDYCSIDDLFAKSAMPTASPKPARPSKSSPKIINQDIRKFLRKKLVGSPKRLRSADFQHVTGDTEPSTTLPTPIVKELVKPLQISTVKLRGNGQKRKIFKREKHRSLQCTPSPPILQDETLIIADSVVDRVGKNQKEDTTGKQKQDKRLFKSSPSNLIPESLQTSDAVVDNTVVKNVNLVKPLQTLSGKRKEHVQSRRILRRDKSASRGSTPSPPILQNKSLIISDPVVDTIVKNQNSTAIQKETVQTRQFFKRDKSASDHCPPESQPETLFISDALIDATEQDEDVNRVLKIISKSPLQSEVYNSGAKAKPVLKTYGNKRKFNKPDIVESFGLPDTPIFPERLSVNEPKRIKKLDIDECLKCDVNIVDTQLLNMPWEIPNLPPNSKTPDNVLDVDLSEMLKGESLKCSVNISSSDRRLLSLKKRTSRIAENLKIDQEKRTSADQKPQKTRWSVLSLKVQSKNVEANRKSSDDSGIETGETDTVKENKGAELLPDKPESPKEEAKVEAAQETPSVSKEITTVRRQSRRFTETTEKSEPRETDISVKKRSLSCDDAQNQKFKRKLPVQSEKKFENFDLGDLVWARIGRYPLWPSLTTKDPVTGKFKREGVIKKNKCVEYHVKFFGDNGRRSWVNGSSMLWFCSADDLKAYLAKNGPKTDPLLKSCKVPHGLLPKWRVAVQEAESLIDKKMQERLRFFANLPVVIRKHTVKLNVSTPPSIKDDGEDKDHIDETITDVIKAYTTEDIEQPEEVQEEENLLHEIISDCSSDSESASKSSNTTTSNPMEEQTAFFKRCNLFKGIIKKQVCAICHKFGNLQRCKGQCNRMLHSECEEQESRGVRIDENPNGEKSDENVTGDELSTENRKSITTSLSLAEQIIDVKMKELMENVKTTYSDSGSESLDESVPANSSKKNFTKTLKKIKHVTADAVESVWETTTTNEYICHYCTAMKDLPCFICNKEISSSGSSIRQRCSMHRCGKFYHPSCLKKWRQTQWSLINPAQHRETNEKLDTFVCPVHVCHTCFAEDPHMAISRCSSRKVVKCLKCPSTYHTSNHCVPAGTVIVSGSQIICPRHFESNKKSKTVATINATWCFICSKGGDLICCETCPTCVHAECFAIDFQEDGTFLCEDCETGRFPLYDEIVWAKLGRYRWWPAIILFPSDIPPSVRNIPHNEGEFAVRFFGTHDHYWIGRGRAFIFQEGDSSDNNKYRKFEVAFNRAIEEAQAAHKIKQDFKNRKEVEFNDLLKPPHYIKIKANKPVGNIRLVDANASNAITCDCDPNQAFPCGPDSDCLNRILMTECSPDMCPAGERCKNQRFGKREYPPLKPYKTAGRGWGLKTLAPIRLGDFIIEYVGELIDEIEYKRRIKKMQQQKEENYYFLTLDRDRIIDAGPKGNVARFMNHSCQPNCETQKWNVNGETRVGLFALEDLPADAEITFNYNLECIGEGKKICRCEAPNCSGFIGVKTKPEEVCPKVKKKSKRRNKRQPIEPVPEPKLEPCFVCQEKGDVMRCHNKACTKFYHYKCLGLDSCPEGKFICPWHNCNVCGKRTIRSCIHCTNSYCPPHSDTKVRHDKFLGFVCYLHDPLKPKNNDDEKSQVIETSTATSCNDQVELVRENTPSPPEEVTTSTPLKQTESTRQCLQDIQTAFSEDHAASQPEEKRLRSVQSVKRKFNYSGATGPNKRIKLSRKKKVSRVSKKPKESNVRSLKVIKKKPSTNPYVSSGMIRKLRKKKL